MNGFGKGVFGVLEEDFWFDPGKLFWSYKCYYFNGLRDHFEIAR